jgi:glycosyltransferase involved in cell wall biosynthesis
MAKRQTIALMNDSFPPTIDGVANVVVNYGKLLQKNHADVVVATPWYEGVEDSYDFPVLRYPSLDLTELTGYRAGAPFSADLMHRLEAARPELIHTHCPLVSTILARMLREQVDAPIVFTYHTKFDIEIMKAVKARILQEASVKFLVANISACDEVWVVSKGAGENLRSLGYTGDYIVMDNGVDFPRARASRESLEQLDLRYGLKGDRPLFLFVGRMMWYKGLKTSLDGLRKVKASGEKFSFLLVGDGLDRAEIEAYVEELGLKDECIFTGAIKERGTLQTIFSRADLFLFPSTFDTNGIVVREAAACSCPSLLIADSCAAEGIVHGRSGLVIKNNAEALAEQVLWACGHRGELAAIGRTAADEIYLSWEDAVARAYARYQIVLANYHSRPRPRKAEWQDNLLSLAGATLSGLGKVKNTVDELGLISQELELRLIEQREIGARRLDQKTAEFGQLLDKGKERLGQKLDGSRERIEQEVRQMREELLGILEELDIFDFMDRN